MRAPGMRALVALLFVAGLTAEESPPAESRVHRVLVKRTPVPRSQPQLAPAPFTLPAAAAAAADVARPQRSAANERWARFISEYAHGGQRGAPAQLPGWARDAVMVDLPLAGESAERPESVPVLVLPVPVPVRSSQCSANEEQEQAGFDVRLGPSRVQSAQRRPRPPPRKEPRPVLQEYDDEYEQVEEEPAPAPPPRRRPAHRRPPPSAYPAAPANAPRPRPRPFAPEPQQVLPNAPPSAAVSVGGKVDSSVLVELFRSQMPKAPQLPPVLIRERRYDVDAPAPAPASAPTPAPSHMYLPARAPAPAPAARTPPPPRFDRSMMLRGELTVYRADFTEPYTALWDAATGAARVEMHGGATTSYRTVTGGNVQRAVMTLDRSGEREAMRCAVMRQSALAASDKIPPVLPDTSKFTFEGYIDFGSVKAEKWRQTVSGQPGQLGAARGEALLFRHELLLTREQDNFAVPLQHSVAVDSSVLGPDCDGYVHRYHEARAQTVDPNLFRIDLEASCDQLEETRDMSAVEPLLEYTMLARDPRLDDLFKGFTAEFDRKYADETEEAVRKNLLAQTNRFVSSGNRLGATFSMGVNFLSDRLDAELNELLGVVLDDEHFAAEAFPHGKHALRDLEAELPDEFDWREEGGVSPVRYQGSCSSCWAFSVAGAVEGALFRLTRRLVPLSEQALVDCAQPYGGRGCGGTWPSHAYDYVQDRGLPALAAYTPYQAKVLQCQDRRVPPVTHISAHVNVTQYSVAALKVAIRQHAPSVVIIDANLKSFQTYKSGVFYDDRCAKDKHKLKHAVLAVGWGTRAGEPHFILKNSWSAAWGDAGYIRLHGPSNTCGHLTLPSYPRLEQEDLRDAH